MTRPRGPRLSGLLKGILKASPEDFVVDEVPAYEPSGSGDHLYVHFRKRDRTTDDAAKAIADALGVPMREVGVAGLKDKVAVTSQWISLLTRDADAEERVRALSLPGIEVLGAGRHGNKLKTGHLRANRFEIVIRGLAAGAFEDVKRAFEDIAREGVPNAFGAQRFGREGDTAEQARAWLTGKARPPQNPRVRRFHFSALQSAVFNAVLEARLEDGTWNVPIEGDLLKKEETGGLFVCTDVQTDRERAQRFELGPTGPLPGDRMRQPEGAARALEERIAAPLLEGVDLHRARSLGEGTRRALRLRVHDVSIAEVMESAADRDAHGDTSSSTSDGEQGRACRVGFVLPKGAYATTVLGSVFEFAVPSAEKSPEKASFGDDRTEEE